MVNFHYEWWTIKIKLATGIYTHEVKAKSKENAIRQIKKYVRDVSNGKILWHPPIVEVYWETLKLDRIGYQRLS